MRRIKPRNEAQEQWLAASADALACAERLAARLAELRGSGDLGPILAIQAEIAFLRQRVEQLERECGARREFHPDWLQTSAWASKAG